MGLRSIIQSLFVRTVHFITIGTAILLLGMVPVGASAATSQLALTPTNLGFGAVVVGQTKTLLVTLTNNGQSSVTVSGIALGKSEFTTSNLSLPLVLLAGQSVELSVSFTPTAMGWTGGPIKFSSNASNATLRLKVAGTGVISEPVTASPSMVSFGQVAIGTISTVPVVLTNARSWKVTLLALQTTGGGFSMSGPSFPLTLGAGQSVTVNVAFAPQSAGTTGGKLFVSGPGLAIPLTGTGTAPGQLTSNLGSLNFANVPVGSSQTQSVTLTNSGGSGLTVSHATLTGTGFTLSGLALPLTLGAGQSATFSVVFAPQSAGSASGNLAIASNATNPAMNLPLSGNTALVAITVNPNNATLVVGSNQQFIANVTGTSKTAVAWTVSGAGCIGVACGTISVNGLYVPPSSVPSPATVTVKATSVADPTKSASANVAIVGAVAVLLSITPTSASVPTAGMQPFTASVTGTSTTAVTWGLSGAGCIGSSCGTLATSSLSAVYLAPSVAPTPASVNVIATSVVDPTKSASANLIIVPAVVVGVTPANVSATAGTTQQFAASVTGTSNTAVTWTVSGTGCSGATCGTISSAGLYNAPATAPSPATVTITATSVSDPSKSASATIAILQPPSIQLPTPTVSLLPAIFAPGITVSLADTNPAAVICYTTDGTGPALSPAGACGSGTSAYTAPIALMATTTIRAVAVLPGTNEISNSLSATYTIQAGNNNIKLDQSLTLGGAQTAIATAAATTTSLVRAQSGGQILWQLLPNAWGAGSSFTGSTTVAYPGTGSVTVTVNEGSLPLVAVDGSPVVHYGGDVYGDQIGNSPIQLPYQLSQLGSLITDVAYTLTNTTAPSNQDVFFDEWLMPTNPFSGGQSGAVEVGIFAYYSGFTPPGSLVTTMPEVVLLNGALTTITYSIYMSSGPGPGAFVLFVPGTQLTSGEIQFNMLDFLNKGASVAGVNGWYVAGLDYATEYGNSSSASYTLTTTKLGLSQMLRPASY
jgi:hypothetical protein